jgi:hypothetical protein
MASSIRSWSSTEASMSSLKCLDIFKCADQSEPKADSLLTRTSRHLTTCNGCGINKICSRISGGRSRSSSGRLRSDMVGFKACGERHIQRMTTRNYDANYTRSMHSSSSSKGSDSLRGRNEYMWYEWSFNLVRLRTKLIVEHTLRQIIVLPSK